MTDIIDGLTALINNSEGRLYDHERAFLKTAIDHIHGMRVVAGKASSQAGEFREMTVGIRRRSDEPGAHGGAGGNADTNNGAAP
jgi:hypothetical protein